MAGSPEDSDSDPSADGTSFLTGGISKLFEETGPATKYSGMGVTEDRFVRNLSQLERASPKAHAAAVKEASSRSQAAVILSAAVPKIEEVLRKNDGPSWDEMRQALVESRLRGTRGRWEQLAEHAQRAAEIGLKNDFENGLMTLLRHVAGKRGIPQDVAETAHALYQKTGIETLRNRENSDLFPDTTAEEREARKPAIAELRNFLSETFRDAAHSVERTLKPEDFDRITSNSGFQKALGLYKDLLEKPLAENHAENEGVFSTALGPLGAYYPLIPVGKEESALPGRRLAYRKPQNIANEFATGMSPSGFDTTMAPFAERISRAIRGNNKAALLTTLQQEGLLRPLHPGDESQVITWRGREHAAVSVETKPEDSPLFGGPRQGGLYRPRLEKAGGSTPEQFFASADARFGADRGVEPGHLYVNHAGAKIIEAAIQRIGGRPQAFHGVTLNPIYAERVHEQLLAMADAELDAGVRAAVKRVAELFGTAIQRNATVSVVNADPAIPAREIRDTEQEEGLHAAVTRATGNGIDLPFARAFLSTPAGRVAAEALRRWRPEITHPVEIAGEVPVDRFLA